MNFTLQSLKIKTKDGVSECQVTVQTQSGVNISTVIPEKEIKQALDMLESDITLEVKIALRKDIQQLQLRDESQSGT